MILAVLLICQTLLCQTLLRIEVGGEGPLRFGMALPAEQLQRGLHTTGVRGAELQWSYLQDEADARTGKQWVELAILAAKGRIEIRAGGAGPSPRSGGDLCRYAEAVRSEAGLRLEERTWTWANGDVQTRARQVFTQEWLSPSGEIFAAGEARRRSGSEVRQAGLQAKFTADMWRAAGLLPKAGRLGSDLREQLLSSVRRLPTAPGERGRGDYLRGDYLRGQGVVTNLEFDTTLALLRLGLFSCEDEILALALESARHSIDRDLDRESGLPYRHGRDHRHAPPEPGHVWLQGLLLTGLVFADRELIDAARSIGRSLAARLSRMPQLQLVGEDAWRDRLRDEAWPLWELEILLAFEDHPKIRAAADRLAARMLARWDARNRVLRYGEGESRGEAYKERAWLTGGLLLPALRAHHRRTGQRPVGRLIADLEAQLRQQILAAGEGMPVQYWLRDGQAFSIFRLSRAPEAVMLLEGLSPRVLKRCLRRAGLRDSLLGVLEADDPNLATSFSMVGRCTWIYR